MAIRVIGGGLAGVEAAYQIAKRKKEVILYEMRPKKMTPAHRSGFLAEIVCSNSFKSKDIKDAHGLLKEEMSILDSIVLKIAKETEIPGGKALVVDRWRFAERITEEISKNPLIRIVREEITDIPEGIVIIATGPLTSEALTQKIVELTGKENLHFFDAISPIVDGTTIDMEKAFFGSRYAKDQSDYLNLPLSKEEYEVFYRELINAKKVELREFEKTPYFEGCLPIEVLAERGIKTLLYGPMKPVGLKDPRTNKMPYAVVQLRREDKEGSMYNMVGFQTKMTYPEQERVFRLIPALRNAKFLRYGSIHRNTFINSPELLTPALRLKKDQRILFAGQITGVEGYMEAAAMGIIAGISASFLYDGKEFTPPPSTTCIGALIAYITEKRSDFQPMNINFGLLKDYTKKKKEALIERALTEMKSYKASI
ncbi:MAG: methylenetetrahydrofolate--tRNA-(uracil(54)-C(5))-methyltransferase (FADH(2)-oxidizing) TrmFO [Desulfobacterota bacterium]|nr:methylenetetrahydrofolate--tRNA-(uracil(54)-C(5))-methyltransferase (FADH(2)-oxidizing) TrmFO [Thermodesulfobacteriota bacterium]MDW8002410.1 methylenetetrahydrofolate--tRNA-(uracil(54)-C(5))-methyltransferase (FADH(2)-oxidizing) TrmFO [Deltaproteobacteria bacterium]